MNRKFAAVVVAAAVAAAVAFLMRSGDAPDDLGEAGGAEAAADPSPSPGAEEAAFGGAPVHGSTVAMADDPEGNLLLEGQVIDGDDIPVGGVEVTVDSNPPRQVVTEADGSFAIEDLIGRTYTITAVAESEVGGPVRHELTETSEPVIVRLRQAASVIVSVQDDAGGPIEGASVYVHSDVDREGTTGRDGTARVSGVSRGFAVVSARADGYGPVREAIQVPDRPGAEVSVTLALAEGAAISGRVLSADGAPVAGAQVVAEDAAEMFSMADPEVDGVVTDSDGRYEIPAVSAGNVRVVATHDRYPSGSSSLIATDGRRPVTGVDIEMAPAASVAGRVVDDHGQPAAWASVRVAPARTTDMRRAGVRGATTDEDGTFEVVGLERRPAQIVATSDGLASAIVELDLGARARLESVELSLEAPARIAGTVVDGDGEPVPEVHVLAYPDVMGEGMDAVALRGSQQAVTDGGGRFELSGLPEGGYRLQAGRSAAGWSGQAPSGVTARTGDDDVTITLHAPGGVKGRVVLEEGGSPGAFSVAVGGTAGTPFAGADGGAFEVDGIEPGARTVMVRGPGFASRTLRQVEIEPGAVTDLGTISVTRGRGLSGRVYDASGAPIAGATVVLGSQLFGDGKSLTGGLGAFADQMGMRTAETDDGGFYEIVGIPASRQTIAAEHPEGGRSLAAAVPAGPGSLELDLELVPFGSVRGQVTVGGEPASGVTITATGKTDAEQHVMVTAAGDGSFLIERLAAGEHRITATMGGMMGGQMEGRDVEVLPGEEAHVEIDVGVGNVSLEVSVTTDDGSSLGASQVFLVEGIVQADSADDVNRLFREGEGSMASAFAMGDAAASFDRVIPATYSVCAIPIAGSLEDPEVIRELQERPGELPVHCRPQQIRAAPEAQSIEVEVPAPPPLGTGGEGREPGAAEGAPA